MPTNDVKDLLNHVIRTVDRWWVNTPNLKQGYFTRSTINNSSVTYKDYVEWRYSEMVGCYDYEYVSIFISLEYEDGIDYIRMRLRKLKNGVYTEYDPFCEIHDGLWNVTISKDTGGFDEWFSIFGKNCFNDLTDDIATTVNRFTNPPSNEESVNVNMDDVSKTLSSYDIQDIMIKAMRIMLIDRDTVNELTRLSSKFIIDAHDLSPTRVKNMLGYAIEATPNHVVTRIVYGDVITLCSFTCKPDIYGKHEFIIRYNSRDTGFQYTHGFNILYKDPESHCFEYTADGLDVEKVFKPFVNILRNTLNYELYQQLTKSEEETMDTETKAPAVKPGLMTKETFVLDKDYFKIGDIYCLCIHPEFQGDVHMIYTGSTAVNATLPKWTYAICSDVCDTVIDFTFKRADKNDLVYIQIHAEDIEKGLIEVTRQLCNENLIQDNEEE